MAQARIVPGAYLKRQAPQDWRDIVREYRVNLEAHNQDREIMTERELRASTRGLKEFRESHSQEVLTGALKEFETVIAVYRSAGERVAAEKRREVARWNPDRLLAEMRLADQLVQNALRLDGRGFGGASHVSELEELLQEALNSGDLHKARGVCETLRASMAGFIASGAPLEERTAANRLAKRAEDALKGMRITPDLIEAQQEREAAGQSLLSLREELLDTGDLMDGASSRSIFPTSAYAKAARRVELKHGQIEIYEPDSSEVTGVYIKPGVVANE